MKKITFFVISLLTFLLNFNFSAFANIEATNKINLQEFSFVGQIEDENFKKYNGFFIEVKSGNDIIHDINGNICKTKSETIEIKNNLEFEKGIFNLNCLLEEGKTYNLVIKNTKNIIIDNLDFVTNKFLFTVGKEKYNDLQTGISSKNNNISLFSQEYKVLKEKEFRRIWEYEGELDPNFISKFNTLEEGKNKKAIFKCKNENQLINLPYNVKIGNEIVEEGLLIGDNFIDTFILPNDSVKIYYQNDGKEQILKLNFLSNDENFIFVTCNKKNSIKKEQIIYPEIDKILNNKEQEKENIITNNNLNEEKQLRIEGLKYNEIKSKDSNLLNNNYVLFKIQEKYNYQIILNNKKILIGNGNTYFKKEHYGVEGKVLIYLDKLLISNGNIIVGNTNDLNLYLLDNKKLYIIFSISFLLAIFTFIIYIILKNKNKNKNNKLKKDI